MPVLSPELVIDAAFLMRTAYLDRVGTALGAAGWTPLSNQIGPDNFLYSNDGPVGAIFSDAQAFVAYRAADNTLAVVFEGSGNLFADPDDWVSNLGSVLSWNPLYVSFVRFLNFVREQADLFPTAQILVTGHSQGGALAEFFLAAHEAMFGDRLLGVTFASPGISVVSDPLSSFGTSRLIRIEHTNDMVVDATEAVRFAIAAGLVVGPIGLLSFLVDEQEIDLQVSRPEAGPLLLDPLGLFDEHSSALYQETVLRLFRPSFGQELLAQYSTIAPILLSDSGGSRSFSGGADVIIGGSGQDFIYGQAGADTIGGWGGFDSLYGGVGNDWLDGGTGNDTLYGGENDDRLHGGAHSDVLIGEANNDSLYGDTGSDNLFGGSGQDSLFGGDDRDFLTGGVGSDTLDGGVGYDDVAVFVNSSADYWIEWVFGYYRVSSQVDLLSAEWEGVDYLEHIEKLQFSDGTKEISEWLTIQNGTAVPPVEPPPPPPPPPPSGPVANPLLSVTPVNQTLQAGDSVALSAIFPQSNWVDGDGLPDLQWFRVQDRSAGGGYLTCNGVAMDANTVFTRPVSELGNWAFVAGSGAATDEIGFQVIQADGDYSPRLTTGAIITTVPANTVTPPADDHGNSQGSATVLSSGVVTGFVSVNGTIGTASDQDWFSVELQAGQTYAFLLWPNGTTNSHLDPRLTVRLPNGSTVTNDNLTVTTLTSFVSITASQTGTYYLRAEGVNGTTGDFILTASPITVDPTAGGLTQGSGNTDPNPGNSFWQWQGTSGDDRPSDSMLEAGGNPQTTSNNYYRGHGGDDRIYADTGDDLVWGDSGEDSLYGEEGRDTLRGGNSDDSLYGGDDADLLYGEDGDDYMSAGDGNDTLYGDDEDDTLRGGDGEDYIKGEDDNDDIDGGYDDDQLYGDRGDDTVEGGYGNDFMMGGSGNDSMDGDGGHDRLAGEDGADFLDGDDGDDEIYGGDDNDTLIGQEGNDILHGEDGIDTVDYWQDGDGVRINLFDEIAVSTDHGTDRLYEIENVRGSSEADIIDGDHGQNVLDGYHGSDNIRGHNADDTLLGGNGNDTLWGDAGNDNVAGEADDDELRGGLGTDTLNGGDGNDHLRGEQNNDTVDGGLGTDTVFFWGEREDFSIVASGTGYLVTDLRTDGLEGQDAVSNVEFFEFFDGVVSESNILLAPPVTVADEAATTALTPIVLDVLQNDSAGGLALELLSVEVLGGIGIAYVAGNQIVFDPRGAFDSLESGTSAVVTLTYIVRSEGLLSTTGSVLITVGSVHDRLTGDSSGNELSGHDGNDTLNGGAGNDYLYGGVGNDLLTGGTGNDRIDGGDGTDRAYFTGTLAATVNLGLTTSQNTGHGTDTILNVEHVTSGTGNDRLTGSALGNSLSSGDGNDTLNGGLGNDSLYGGLGADLLTGGMGNDRIDGGDGSDRAYFTGTAAITVNLGLVRAQNTGHGTDTILNVEHVTSGVGNDRLTGSALGNILSSGDGNDRLSGGAGNDYLYAGAGIDILTGGTGRDSFVFNSQLGVGNVDRVTDFNVSDDTIRLENSVFVGLAGGVLAAGAFTSNLNGNAGDTSDRIVYETDTGRLYFDQDGAGGVARLHFATLSANLGLTNADFLVF